MTGRQAASTAALVAAGLAAAASLIYVAPLGQDGNPIIPLTGSWRTAKLLTPVLLAAAAAFAVTQRRGFWVVGAAAAAAAVAVISWGFTWHYPSAVALVVAGWLSWKADVE